MSTLDDLITAISTRALKRFVFSAPLIHLLMPSTILTQDARNLRRSSTEGGERTILIASLKFEHESLQAINRWAAEVRDQLPDPEASDLYMFLIIDDITLEDAGRIEADEHFCRKLVLRKDEPASKFLDRTFLSALTTSQTRSDIGDPFLAALTALAASHAWTSNHTAEWRELLLSDRAAPELAQELKETMLRRASRD